MDLKSRKKKERESEVKDKDKEIKTLLKRPFHLPSRWRLQQKRQEKRKTRFLTLSKKDR